MDNSSAATTWDDASTMIIFRRFSEFKTLQDACKAAGNAKLAKAMPGKTFVIGKLG